MRHKKVKHGGLELPSRGPVSNPKEELIIKLPREREARKRSMEEEDEYLGLMPTPQSEEELNLGPARLNAAQVPRPREMGLRYELTRTLVAMVRQSSGLEELRDVLRVADVVVQTREEFQEALAKAEARGQVRAGVMSVLEEVPRQPGEASLPEGAVVPGSRCWGSSAMGGAAPEGMRKPSSSQTFSLWMGKRTAMGPGMCRRG